jgi:Spy/CpxP family protein refolding chaperone
MLPPAEKNPKVLLTLVFVFLAGAATGALSMSLGLHEKLHHAVAAAGPASPPAAPARSPSAANHDAVLERFKSELNLTPEQTEKIGTVLDDYQNYFDSLREQLDDVRSTGKMRILEILDARQREKFERVANELVPGQPAAPAK